MGTVKDIFDIPKELHDRIEKRKQTQKLQASDYLFVIAESLEKVRQKLESRQLPKEEGNFLAEIIKHANNFAEPLKDDYPELAKVFDIQLNQIMFQIQIADYFFDGKARWDSSLSEDGENIILTKTADFQIANACEEIKKVKGIISAHATKFKIDGR